MSFMLNESEREHLFVSFQAENLIITYYFSIDIFAVTKHTHTHTETQTKQIERRHDTTATSSLNCFVTYHFCHSFGEY